jgi:hypothetical protein
VGELNWGESSDRGTVLKESEPRQFHEIKLSGLEPEMLYYYSTASLADGERVPASHRGTRLESEVSTLQTANKPETPFGFVVLSDTPGVLRDVNDPESLITHITAAEARQMIADGTIAGGMIPKIEGCLDTLAQGVKKIHIIDGRLRHSLLLEIYTTSGVGTELVRDESLAPRKPAVKR